MCKPLIWYMAAGYGVPAGIEAHILHYATEMRKHGFDTKVVVFKRVCRQGRAEGSIHHEACSPRRGEEGGKKHRFLVALEERGIEVVSLEELARARIGLRMAALFVPWFVYILLAKRRWPDLNAFKNWVIGNARTVELRRRLRIEDPAVVHVFGRLQTDAWAALPVERTIFHEMMTGTVDEYWSDSELKDFKFFIERAACVFAPGKGVVNNLKREFGIKRVITPIFTMVPDEVRG